MVFAFTKNPRRKSGSVQFFRDLVIWHKLVLESVSYPKIVENTPILIEQGIACNVYT